MYVRTLLLSLAIRDPFCYTPNGEDTLFLTRGTKDINDFLMVSMFRLINS